MGRNSLSTTGIRKITGYLFGSNFSHSKKHLFSMKIPTGIFRFSNVTAFSHVSIQHIANNVFLDNDKIS